EGSRFAARAYAAHADQGVGPTLLDFVRRVGDAKTGRSPGGGGFPWSVLVTIAAVAAARAVLVRHERWPRRTHGLRPVRRAERARAVPACEADAERVEAGAEPAARHVLVGGRPVPYWDAPPAFDAWRDGYFGRRSVLT